MVRAICFTHFLKYKSIYQKIILRRSYFYYCLNVDWVFPSTAVVCFEIRVTTWYWSALRVAVVIMYGVNKLAGITKEHGFVKHWKCAFLVYQSRHSVISQSAFDQAIWGCAFWFSPYATITSSAHWLFNIGILFLQKYTLYTASTSLTQGTQVISITLWNTVVRHLYPDLSASIKRNCEPVTLVYFS